MSKEKNLVKIKKPKNSNTIFGLPPASYIDEDFCKKKSCPDPTRHDNGS